MAGGSVLKKLKSNLQENNLLRHQGVKSNKRKRDAAQKRDQKEHDQRVLKSIREAFNPFDTKQNREKFEIIGKSKTPAESGRPTVAKTEAQSQRKSTYEAQKKLKNRVGGLVDRRFGEKDKSISLEDKMVARYAREKMLRTSKKSVFDLEDGDDDVLTHGGRALSFADDFAEDDLGIGSDDESVAKKMRISGAGEDLEDMEEGSGKKKSKNDVMKEIIAKSKMHKALRQQTNAENEELVQELNEADAFDDLMANLKNFDEEHEPSKWEGSADTEYDLHVREMAYDRRAQPGERTKTDEELRKEEEERIKKLEAQRLSRMEGDDLEDALDIDEDRDDAAHFGLNDDGFYNNDSEQGGSEELSAEEDDAPPSHERQTKKVAVPSSIQELRNYLGTEEQLHKLRSLIRRCDPSAGAGNKEIQGRLTCLIARYAAMETKLDQFNGLVGIIRELAPKHNIVLGQYFRDAVDLIHHKGLSKRSSLQTLVLISSLFSTSDQWHVVANAATLVVTMHLSQSVDTADFALNLFLCDILLFNQRLSKRYIPEVSATLVRILASSASDSEHSSASDLAASHSRLADSTIQLSPHFQKLKEPPTLSIDKLSKTANDDIVMTAVRTTERASALWRSLTAYPEVFGLLSTLIKGLPQNKYTREAVERLDRSLKFSTAERKPLQLQELKPIAIKTQAPHFEDNYNPEVKGYDMDPERRELAKLKSQLKKERKTTLKEIRRDAEFETREKMQESRKAAEDYHRKLARITNQINSEEGAERNMYEREKRAAKRQRR